MNKHGKQALFTALVLVRTQEKSGEWNIFEGSTYTDEYIKLIKFIKSCANEHGLSILEMLKHFGKSALFPMLINTEDNEVSELMIGLNEKESEENA